MLRKFLNNEITFKEMTRKEFVECINEWKQHCIRIGMLNVEASEFIKESLIYHKKNDVENEYEKNLIIYYLANEV